MAAIISFWCAPTGECYLASTTRKPCDRIAALKWMLRKGAYGSAWLQAAWDTYGPDAFTWDIVEECSDDELRDRMQYRLDSMRPALNRSPTARSVAGIKQLPEVVAAKSAHMRAICPESRMRALALAQQAALSPEVKAKRLASLPPDHLERMRERANSPEARAKRSASMRNQSPEARARRSAGARASWEKRRAA